MDSKQIRTQFTDFFESKGHKVVPSDSMVIKGDPTLMFTNAGMNQFKDIFLGGRKPDVLRVVNSQKCLRVSGKHNDLEEVGHDTYHHTMFEMLGNWSFGDYFKKEAIEYAWELLTEVYKIDKDNLYVSVFGGDKNENLPVDTEAEEYWKKLVPAEKIIYGSKKDNFWEMGDMGPCGPCSEIHIDLRDKSEQKKTPGRELINKDNPLVIEIWNLVFIQFNRKADGSLEQLPNKHVDTGMGFERLCTVLQGKKSNYDTDIFQTIISAISKISGIKYGQSKKTDIALRVIADHLRAVSFAIADGQLPSNVKAGYVIRRILRRAVRYGYSFLDMKEAFIYQLVDVLSKQMGAQFPELLSQKQLIENVIKEEETIFLRTLDKGIKLLDDEIRKLKQKEKTSISGEKAFVLYDTYGFPFDLTELIVRENGLTVDNQGFDVEMKKQKDRARNAAEVNTDDWTIVIENENCEFVGYDFLKTDVKISKYRKVKQKNTQFFHLVFDKTPFYSESGGQVGDSGFLISQNEKIEIQNTIKEHNQIIHISNVLPEKIDGVFSAEVNIENRISTTNNHSATHLLHYALRKVLGIHIEQKGSLVDPDKLRFDFSHFSKLSDEEIRSVEIIVNEQIRRNVNRKEQRNLPISEAKKSGAIALFGEKYGDRVRVIGFGDSIELCGGTHVESTGQIGFFKIISEGAIAAGVRRIEAITGKRAETYILSQLDSLKQISLLLNGTKDIVNYVSNLIEENAKLNKKIETFHASELRSVKKELISGAEKINSVIVICKILQLSDINDLKELCSQVRAEVKPFACVLGTVIDSKPYLAVAFSEDIINEKGFHAGNMIREIAKFIQGGGGGQPFVATAGGKNPDGINDAVEFGRNEIIKLL
ncbi:MAG TPA: alanine--tRNA ligase [Bacteroidales bacterium]|nr:alanine--tRNA ligase [Bacteroidales bacterium]